MKKLLRVAILAIVLFSFLPQTHSQTTLGGVNLGSLTDYLLVFTRGNTDANWQGATKGFVGNVAVNGITAHERTSGSVPYAGTLFTNASALGAWQNIADDNIGQATVVVNATGVISGLATDLGNAFTQIDALVATTGYTSVSAASLNGLNTQNNVAQTFVINITSGFSISSKITITGDRGDVFILRWDTDADPSDGYQGQVKFQSGGGIVPAGNLTPTNFIHVAGDIASSGGGTNPAAPYPQGPRYSYGLGALINNGADFNGGGFFTGYWLTTGGNDTANTSLSNAIFVGGWYTSAKKFSLTSGTSGVYVAPPQEDTNEKKGIFGDNSELLQVNSYPNPVVNELRISLPTEWQNMNVSCEVISITGTISKKIQLPNAGKTICIDMKGIAPGNYIVRISNGRSYVQQKIVKHQE